MKKYNWRFVRELPGGYEFAWDPPAEQEHVWLIRPDGKTTYFRSATKSSYVFKVKQNGTYRLRVMGELGSAAVGLGAASSQAVR